ncbi:hypothetical protein EIK76_15140 [Rheinheimera mesophila]|uniref:VanZ-like domain-containing protein n=1 Tax=Rheinheimera mesophila TaxID=1547515 RepID=A0A3P3QF33_9GAMM|nr:VanZ family protein [Rheinheimera mesophila]KKL00704.1 hypothetical protein SD53_13665 [Rheinheimera mesophila]RRJ19764.1 hypothetical protein EIK76_15140 [Rheinheimera mesophila]
MKRHLYHAICLLVFTAATFGFLTEVKSSGINLNSYDKHLHFLIFFCLTALLQWSYKPKLWQAVVIMAAYGVAIEFLQNYLTSYRRAELLDWVADILGVAAFYLCYVAVKAWRHRSR